MHAHIQRLIMVVAVMLFTGLVGGESSAQDADRCARADDRLATRGRGDSDYDGLSNCREKHLLGTSHKDPDSDDDGVDDGDEIADGTDPLDPDSDDDGLDDGEEADLGTDPSDPDSDDDGVDDGEDPDPRDDLDSEIEGNVDAISCGTAASIVVLGIPIEINDETEYEGAETCGDLASRFAANGMAHVEVDVLGTLASGFIAEEVELDDADGDGSPDDVDDDDDNDGIDDDDDDDDDGDGVDDDEDDDEDDD